MGKKEAIKQKKPVIKEGKVIFYGFNEENGILSNFYPCKIELDNKTWSTVENYFQANKFVGQELYDIIQKTENPGKAFSLSRKNPQYTMRTDWRNVKVQIMRKALQARAEQSKQFLDFLLQTGNAEIIQHSKKDSFWGDGSNEKGQNQLGKLLMNIRNTYLKKQQESKTEQIEIEKEKEIVEEKVEEVEKEEKELKQEKKKIKNQTKNKMKRIKRANEKIQQSENQPPQIKNNILKQKFVKESSIPVTKQITKKPTQENQEKQKIIQKIQQKLENSTETQKKVEKKVQKKDEKSIVSQVKKILKSENKPLVKKTNILKK